MVIFERIRWKNFLSTGNHWTEIDLVKNHTNLIIGKSGNGKSTFLDAMVFVLFGKPFRNINKPLLVNTINEKNCEVEVEFSTQGNNYKVLRGIKPNIFEIWKNSKLVDQDASSRDYQEILEKTILRMNHKTFTQVVILGSATYTPFMQLEPAPRRAIIENLLDIEIFSVMNVLVKQRLSQNKENLEQTSLALKLKEEHKDHIRKTLESLKEDNQTRIDILKQEAKEIALRYESSKKVSENLKSEQDSLTKELEKLTENTKRHNELLLVQQKILTRIEHHKKDLEFFHDNENCPTCRQIISEDTKGLVLDQNSKKVSELEDGLSKLKNQIGLLVSENEKLEKITKRNQELTSEIITEKARMNQYASRMKDIKLSIDSLSFSDKTVIENELEFKNLEKELDVLSKKKENLLDERLYIDTAISLLKDGGIKTRIIKQYIPVINKLINKYLSKLGFFVDFHLNESFEETIKSRYRDAFSYHSFSEGEKKRIDIALLFAWRNLAELRNSASTNLLIMDEVTDGSLDADGVDEFLKLLGEISAKGNVFVITHKVNEMYDKFDRILQFEKKNGFSLLVEPKKES